MQLLRLFRKRVRTSVCVSIKCVCVCVSVKCVHYLIPSYLGVECKISLIDTKKKSSIFYRVHFFSFDSGLLFRNGCAGSRQRGLRMSTRNCVVLTNGIPY